MRSAHIVAALAGLMAPARPLASREGEGRGEAHRTGRARKAPAAAARPHAAPAGRTGTDGAERRSVTAPRTAGGITR